MPLAELHDHTDRAWAIWRITESEQELAASIHPFERVPDLLTNAQKRLEFLAGRVLIKTLLKKWDLEFIGLTKDEAGKPFFRNHPYHLSLSHSYPYVAAVIDRNKSVGIDLEQPKSKLLRIAARVLNARELNDADQNIVKHCIYWCSKEALIKIYGKRHLILAKELAVEPFQLENEGNLIGSIIADNTVTTVPLYYRVYDNFVVVLNI